MGEDGVRMAKMAEERVTNPAEAQQPEEMNPDDIPF